MIFCLCIQCGAWTMMRVLLVRLSTSILLSICVYLCCSSHMRVLEHRKSTLSQACTTVFISCTDQTDRNSSGGQETNGIFTVSQARWSRNGRDLLLAIIWACQSSIDGCRLSIKSAIIAYANGQVKQTQGTKFFIMNGDSWGTGTILPQAARMGRPLFVLLSSHEPDWHDASSIHACICVMPAIRDNLFTNLSACFSLGVLRRAAACWKRKTA